MQDVVDLLGVESGEFILVVADKFGDNGDVDGVELAEKVLAVRDEDGIEKQAMATQLAAMK